MEKRIGLPLLSFTGGAAQDPEGHSRPGVGRWAGEIEVGRRAREIEAGCRAREIEAGPAKCPSCRVHMAGTLPLHF